MIDIVRAEPRHLETLAKLFDAYRRFFTHKNDLGVSQHFIGERMRNGDSAIFVAVRSDVPCGFIQLYPIWSSWYCKRIWFLSDLYVDEEARGAGVGSMLVERVKAHAAETGASSIMVELPRVEPHLQAFYDRLGFHRDAIFDLARYQP